MFERAGFAALVGAEPLVAENGSVSPAYLYGRVDDVEAAAARLRLAGARPLGALAPRSWGEAAA